MSDEQVMNEAMTIFGAGHETTAYTLTFAWYALSQNPRVAEKLHEEVDSILNGRAATLDDLPNLPYTERVIKETLRLYPPAWGFSRGVIEEFEIGGYTIPRKSAVVVAPWTLGRDARWFAHPQVFDPERFNAENEPNIPRYAFIPFGGGPRVCIGNQFAMLEARLVLATIAQHFRLELKPGFSTQPKRAFTLRPSNGMKMIARVREAIPAL
jgi:cytochrome P450